MTSLASTAGTHDGGTIQVLLVGEAAIADRIADRMVAVTGGGIEPSGVATAAGVGDRLATDPLLDCVLVVETPDGPDAPAVADAVRTAEAGVPVVAWLPDGADPAPVLEAGAVDVVRGPFDPPTDTDVGLLVNRIRTAVAATTSDPEDRETVRMIYDVISDPNRDFLEAVDALLELGTRLFGVELGMFSRIDGTDYEIRAIQPESLAADLGLAAGDTLPLEATYCERTARTDATVSFQSIADATDRDAERDATTELGAACYVGSPVRVDGEVVGTFCFFGQEARQAPFTGTDRSLLEFMADWIGAQLTRQRRETELENTFDRISDGFFAVDDEWRITYVNDRFEAILGRGPEELLGENLWEAFPDAINDLFYDEYHRAMREQTPVSFEEYFEPIGTWFDVRAYPDEDGLSVYFQDITERKRREETLEGIQRETRRLLTATTDAEIAGIAADAVTDTLDLELGGVFLRDGDAEVLRCAAAAGPAGTDSEDRPREHRPGSLVWRTFEAGEARRIDDLDAADAELADGATPVASALVLPVGDHGVLTATATDPHAFDDSDLSLARLLAASTEAALDRAAQDRELQVRTRAMEKASIPLTLADPDDPDTPLVYVNEAFEATTGYDAADAVGRNCRFLQGPETDPEAVDRMRTAIEREESVSVELRNYRADGTPFWNEVELTPIRGEDGELLRYLGSQRDVTDRHERTRVMRELLETSRALMRAETRAEVAELTAQAVDDILGYGVNGVRLYDAEADELRPVAVHGRDRVDVPERPVYAPGEGGPGQAFEAGEALLREHLDPRSDHDYGELRSAMYLPLGRYGTLTVASSGIDAFDDRDVRIAELLTTSATAALERAERQEQLLQYEAALENVQDMLYVTDAAGRFRLITEPLAAYLGYDREELLGDHVSRVLDDAAVEAGQAVVQELLEDGDAETDAYEVEVTAADGARRQVEIRIALLPSEGGFRGTVGSVTDITELRETKRELGVERDRFRYLFENIPDPVVEVSFEDGRPVIQSANDAFEATFHPSDTDPTGTRLNEVVAPDEDRPEAQDLDQELLETGGVTAEIRRLTTDGPREFLLRGVRYEVEGETRAFAIYTDITDQRRRQRHLQVLNRVLRHNLRNDLNVVMGYSGRMAELVTDPELERMAARIVETTEHLSGLSGTAQAIERVLEHPEARSAVDLGTVVEDAADRIRGRYPAARISIDVPGSLSVQSGPQFRTAIENVLDNAIEHNPRDNPQVWVSAEAGPGDDQVTLRVRDNGRGIPDDEHAVVTGAADISQLQHGSGLGLWLVKWAIEAAGGEVDFETPPDGGTLVRIELQAG